MDLASKMASGNYKGFVTFSDIHAHAEKLKKGIRYAIKNDLFIVFLGDLVDGHDKPLETVVTVKQLLDEDRAVLVIGNHDDKFHRYAKGNKVILKGAQKRTLEDVPEDKREFFLQTITDIVTHRNSALTHRLHNWTFIHGAAHKTVWDDRDNLHKSAKHRALYGQSSGKMEPLGWRKLIPDAIRDTDKDFPVREYDWVDDIPADQNVVVGHDRNPMGKKLKKTGPHTHAGELGGKAVFTDMGCGKGGQLCLAVFSVDGEKVEMTGHEAI